MLRRMFAEVWWKDLLEASEAAFLGGESTASSGACFRDRESLGVGSLQVERRV